MKLRNLFFLKIMFCFAVAHASLSETDVGYEAQQIEFATDDEAFQVHDIFELDAKYSFFVDQEDFVSGPAILSLYFPKRVKIDKPSFQLFPHLQIVKDYSSGNIDRFFDVQNEGVVIKQSGFYRINLFITAMMGKLPQGTKKMSINLGLLKGGHKPILTARQFTLALDSDNMNNFNFDYIMKLDIGDKLVIFSTSFTGPLEHPVYIRKNFHSGVSIEKVN